VPEAPPLEAPPLPADDPDVPELEVVVEPVLAPDDPDVDPEADPVGSLGGLPGLPTGFVPLLSWLNDGLFTVAFEATELPVTTPPEAVTVSVCPVTSAVVVPPVVTDTSPAAQATQEITVPCGPAARNPTVPRTAICEVGVLKV
jgi:hypothetical protein